MRVGDGMDEHVDLAVGRVPLVEDGPDLLVGPDVARLDERRTDRGRERPDAPLDEALHGREADGRARPRGTPSRCPRRSSGRSRPRRSAPCARQAVPSAALLVRARSWPVHPPTLVPRIMPHAATRDDPLRAWLQGGPLARLVLAASSGSRAGHPHVVDARPRRARTRPRPAPRTGSARSGRPTRPASTVAVRQLPPVERARPRPLPHDRLRAVRSLDDRAEVVGGRRVGPVREEPAERQLLAGRRGQLDPRRPDRRPAVEVGRARGRARRQPGHVRVPPGRRRGGLDRRAAAVVPAGSPRAKRPAAGAVSVPSGSRAQPRVDLEVVVERAAAGLAHRRRPAPRAGTTPARAGTGPPPCCARSRSRSPCPSDSRPRTSRSCRRRAGSVPYS